MPVLAHTIRTSRWARFLVGTIALASLSSCSRGKPDDTEEKQTPVGSLSRTSTSPPLFVDNSADIQYDIPVKNESGQGVRFTKVRPSCACAGAPKLGKMELAPGEETTLHLAIDLRNRKGPQRFTCYLSEAGGSEWNYSVETTLYERADFSDSGPTHFGMVAPRAEATRQIEFDLRGERPQALPERVAFRTDSENLRVEASSGEVEHLPDGTVRRRYTLRLRLTAGEASGLEQTSLHAEFERAGVKGSQQTAVTWHVLAHYSIAPTQAYFGTIDPLSTKPIQRRVRIRRTDGKRLIIKDVKSPHPCIRCSIEKAPDSSTGQLLLVLDPKTLGAALWGQVTVETDNSAQSRVKIPVAAILRPSK